MRVGWVCFGIAVALAAMITLCDNWKGTSQLATYRAEYAGGGSYKWRGDDLEAFQSILLLGLLAYPAAGASLAIAIKRLFASSERERRPAMIIGLASVGVLGWLLSLGFVSPALQLGP